MIRPAVLPFILSAILATGAPVIAHEGDHQLPLEATKILLQGGNNPKVSLSGKWRGERPAVNPMVQETTLRVFGGFGGDTGAIRLPGANWTALKNGKGWQYKDPAGTSGGITKVTIRHGKKGGKIKLKGGGAGWSYQAGDGARSPLSAILAVSDTKWCAQFPKPKQQKQKIKAKSKRAPTVYASTWEGVQGIFERNGCQNGACHGGAPGAGNLDLRPEVAYDNLVQVFADRGDKLLVQRGSRQDSVLWEKLAAATEGYDLKGRGSPMPVGLPPISADELEAVRLWIQFGAPQDGVVVGTSEVLGGCIPPADPQGTEAPAVPPANVGVQFHAPPWTIPPADPSGLNGEDEVCYATYFDVGAQVPEEFKTPCPEFWGGADRTCYFFNGTELLQDSNSHHSIIHMYRGEFDLAWEPSQPGDTQGFRFRCQGGARDGEKCDPRDADPCVGSPCHGDVVSSLACIGYGPPDYGRGLGGNFAGGSDNAPSVGGSQQPFSRNVPPGGVFGVLPTEGVIVWNSHAFNLFERPVTNEQWWTIYFASPEDRRFPFQGIFDSTDIFVQRVPPFEEREYCRTITFPVGTRIFEFSSHTHERGRLFRIWGPGIQESCRSTIDAPDACRPEPGPPIFITTEYNDPTVLNLNDSMFVLDDPDPASRRFKFCSIYDNGFTNPLDVKRNSTSPIPPQFGNFAPGGKCYYPGFGGTIVDAGIACLDGPRKGEPCGGDDRVCDSSPGAGDGVCDACPLVGGVTTDDEMFILLGAYYCEPGSDCEAGVCTAGPDVGRRCDGDDSRCRRSSCGGYTN